MGIVTAVICHLHRQYPIQALIRVFTAPVLIQLSISGLGKQRMMAPESTWETCSE